MNAGAALAYAEFVGHRTRAFPGGVTDFALTTAFVDLAGDEIVAVDVITGDVRWRRADAGRPLLATDAGLLVVRRRQRRLELALLDLGGGDVKRDLGALPVPDWAADEWEHGDGFVALAEPNDRILHVAWRVARRYRGGAAPSPEVLADAGSEATGVVQIDVDSGRVQVAPDVDPSAIETAVLAERSDVAAPSGEPVFSVAAKPSSDGTTAVTLTARREVDEHPVWETILDKSVSRRPPPLRP